MTDKFLEHVEDAEEFVGQVLGPYLNRPPREDVDWLVGELVRLGLPLATKIAAVPEGERTPQAAGAESDWIYFTTHGPLDQSDHAAWNWSRGLARVVRSLATGVREHQPTGVL
ncbi:hypothetical protein [Streptomyces sp. NPDC048340]|uniref:hypothetical protein n=1 Tax=Streptomyces sp. NPDC048340 TaxID=3365537 RepID=UPI003720BE05